MERYPTDKFWKDTPITKLEQELIDVMKASTMGVTGNSYVIEAKAVAEYIAPKLRKAFLDGICNVGRDGDNWETTDEWFNRKHNA